MEQNTTGETGSTNDSQDVSSSQQDSTASDGHYCYDDANSTSSVHDEVVNSAIMEVSGELMLGKFSSHKHPSAGSESSDISDDDGRRGTAGGSIAKYPESSTGLSDNDWNPYATESDTNHTPRSPRSNASDDQNRIGFISKASINIAPPEKFKDSVATISMATGAVTEGSGADRVLLTERQQLHSRTGDVATRSEPKSDRLDILRYMVDRDDKQDSGLLRSQQPGFRDGGTEPSVTARQSVESVASTRGEDISQSPDTVRSLHTDGTRSERQSIESGRSDEYRRESAESTKSFHSDGSGRSSGKSSEYRRESAESVRSLQSDGTGSRSGRQSTESGRSGRSSRSDLDRSGESNMSGRHSTESHQSVKSDHSRRSEHSQKSTARSAGSDRSDRLDRLSDAGDNIKELIQFESAQRFSSMSAQDKNINGEFPARVPRDGSGDSVTHIRLSAKLEPYTSPTRSAKSPERSQNRVGATGYVSVAERERLVSESPELNQYVGRDDRKEARPDHVIDYERSRPVHSSASLSRLPETLVDRSPSEISMRRVSNLFEETKKQVRAAVAIPRPEPSGSEERFPLQERLSVLQHDSFRSEDKSGVSDKKYGRKENLRDAETARSINSEEVARVLGRYAENDLEIQHRQAPAPTMSESEPKSDNVKVSAFERVDKNQMVADGEDSVKVSDMSDDEIAKRVRAILSETDHLGVVGGNGRTLPQVGQPTSTDYVPRTIDYSRLQRDLQEIQDSLHDVPPPQANDSLYLPSRQVKDMAQTGPSPEEDQYKSLESTCMTLGGRDSGASEYGRKLVWDHGADLQYDVDYTGQFMGTTTSSSETLPQTLKRFGTGDSNSLGVRPDSAATIGSERDALDLESEGSKTLTGSDITRAEKIVDQVLNRRAEGDLQENVEDIIARYRNERRDLFDRLQPAAGQPSSDSQQQHISQPAAPIISHSNYIKPTTPTLNDKPDIVAPSVPDQPQKGGKEPGLAARVYKILTSEPNTYQEPDSHNEKGMAKTVYKILSDDRPQQQVNGILSDAMAEEHEMLKKLVSRPKDDSSMDDSGLNETAESFGLEDRDVRKQLEWSQMSSPEKRDKSGLLDLNAIKQVISAPYSAVSNAKTLLSSQLKKMSERNFDKTIELRTPYRQAIDCYPVYGVERSREPAQEDVREAWMPRVPDRRPTNTSATKERALANDRFFLTEKDRASEFPAQMQTESPRRQRTYSDPFEVSPSRRTASTDRVVHSRCKSEEAADVGDLSQYSVLEPEYSPTERRAASSPRNFRPGHNVGSGLMMTPDQHRPQEWSCECYTSVSDSSDLRSSNEGNMWRYHGYQLYKQPLDPKSDLHLPQNRVYNASSERQFRTSTPHDHDLKGQGQNSPCCGKEVSNPSPVKILKFERQSRSRDKKVKKQKVNFVCQDEMSRSLPNYYEGKGYVEQVPVIRNDVYDLLSRSQAQEEKLAALQRKIFDQKQDYQNAQLNNHLNSGVGHSSNYGNHIRKISPNQGHMIYMSNGARGRYSGRDDSPTESDSSGSKRPTRLRPYRPAGSREVYYVESGDETNESGTTVESTHIGSDDAIPPYIPSQYLGTRKDEPVKHPNGIYGNKDALSTIDENSVKDDKEKALSVSTGSGGLGGPVSTGSGGLGGPVGTGSGGLGGPVGTGSGSLGGPAGRDDPRIADGMRSGRKSPHAHSDPDSGARSSGSWHDTRDARTSDTGYQTSTRSRSPYSERDNLRRDELYPRTNKGEQLEGPGFKTREQFQQDFERRERELKHALSGRHSSDSQEQLGASVRSDPGGQLDDHGPRWEYRDTEEARDFRRLEPEPVYPQERLRCSRSKSDTDLVALSPTESQKYSSPMQPGTRFLELSTQPSPIFSHHDSITYQQRGAPMTRSARDPPELPKVPIERELRPAQHPRELPIVDDRRRSPSPLELPLTRDQPLRPLERGNPGVQPLVPGDESNLQGRQRSTNMMDHVELGVDPRRMGGMRTASQERLMNERSSPVERSKSPVQRSKSPVQRSKSPLQVRQKEMEAELEKLNKQLSEQVNEIQEKKDESPEQFEDNFPPSKKAQVLREVLEQEYVDTLPPNLNDMWTRFKEKKDVSQSESSLNSTRMDALSGLLGNPTYHAVNSFIAEKNELAEKKKQEEREKVDKLREDRQKERERERKLSEVRAAEERSLRRQELMAKHGLSEEESNGSYTEILMEREKKKSSTKTDGRREQAGERKTKRTKSPDKIKAENKSRKDKENQRKGDKGTITDIRNRNKTVKAQHSDSIDTLFSIPEDASFEQSPTKSPLKSRQRRHRHVIDPLMMKLRDKIKLQRDKIDKERRKELQRVEKLKKLEMLLTAKQRGKLSDKAIDVELQDVSSTTTVTSLSESSTLVSDPNSTAISGVESETMSNDSTINSIKLQVKQYSPETRVASKAEKRVTYRPETHVTSRPETHVTSRQRYVESDTTESDFSNIVVERIPEKRSSARKSSGKKEKKIKVDEYGNRIRKEKKDRKKKTEFSGVEMSEDVLAKQLRRYEKYMTPERQKVMQDVSTMYPSPISVSPPRRRKQREVLMKSASIQTSPSMRSSSPSHAYDEVPVAPVPLMSSKQSGRTAHRRPSPSPPRSSQTSPSRKPSKSPPRKSSRSPAYRMSSRSPSAPVKRSGPPPMPRKVVESPMWKPETDSPPPDNSMFTPENGDENTEPVKLGHDAQTWFIPLKPSQPWRQPLKERQAFSVRQEQWEPKSVSQSTWKNIVHGDILKDKGDPNDISRDTKFDLDPEGQPIRDEDSMEDSDDTDMDISKSKPLSKMSLQEAFLLRKQDAISRLRERQKRLNFAAEDRKMEAFLKLERDKLFTEERRKEANPDAHPYSDHLHKPARRVISKEEMKEMSTKRYKKLPEILEKEKLKKRSDAYSLNRIKARLFNRKIQKKVLIKAEKWGR